MARLKKQAIWTISAAALIAAAGGGWFAYDHTKKSKAFQETMDSLVLEVNEDLLNVEYGSDFDQDKFIVSNTGTLETEGSVDPMTVGDSELKVRLSEEDPYGRTAEKEFSYTVHVEDTKAPEILLKEDSVSLYTDDPFDPYENVESVKDPVDGDLKKAETADKGSWTVTTDFDSSAAGEYTATVTAMDVNGNQAEASFAVIVEERPLLDFDPVPGTAGYPYYIRINRALNVVNVYAMDEDGYYSVPYKAMVCSTGDATPLGTYNTTAQYRWLSLFGGVYGQYATRIVGHILFHSVPYFSENPADLEYEEYNKLGTAASMGCIRLCVRDVLWIYENCPVGTTVELYDDFDYPGPMGKPEPLTIDINDERRGWDPTDPDPNNPWNN